MSVLYPSVQQAVTAIVNKDEQVSTAWFLSSSLEWKLAFKRADGLFEHIGRFLNQADNFKRISLTFNHSDINHAELCWTGCSPLESHRVETDEWDAEENATINFEARGVFKSCNDLLLCVRTTRADLYPKRDLEVVFWNGFLKLRDYNVRWVKPDVGVGFGYETGRFNLCTGNDTSTTTHSTSLGNPHADAGTPGPADAGTPGPADAGTPGPYACVNVAVHQYNTGYTVNIIHNMLRIMQPVRIHSLMLTDTRDILIVDPFADEVLLRHKPAMPVESMNFYYNNMSLFTIDKNRWLEVDFPVHRLYTGYFKTVAYAEDGRELQSYNIAMKLSFDARDAPPDTRTWSFADDIFNFESGVMRKT